MSLLNALGVIASAVATLGPKAIDAFDAFEALRDALAEKHPELRSQPLPDLEELKRARDAARARVDPANFDPYEDG